MNWNKCWWLESFLAIVIIVFAVWQISWSKWLIVIAAAILLLHGSFCRSCKSCDECRTDISKAKSKPRKRK